MSRTVKIIDVSRYQGMDPLEMPNYGIREAALYLDIKPSTLQRWTHSQISIIGGKKTELPPLIQLPFEDLPQLSPLNLIEAFVLDGLRTRYNISLPRVRDAIDYTSKQLKTPRPLAKQIFQTDGYDLFVQEAEGLINVSKKNKIGQLAHLDLLKEHLKRVEFDQKGIPINLYLYTRPEKRLDTPKVVAIRPRISGGRPVIAGTRITIEMLGQRFEAGDSLQELAQDYGLTQEQVEEGARSWSVFRARAAALRGNQGEAA